MRQQQQIAFVRGDAADDVLDVLTRGGRGPNDWTVAAVIRWLTDGCDGKSTNSWEAVTDHDGEQVTERPVEDDPDVMHRLVWHEGLRYVGLSHVSAETWGDVVTVAINDNGTAYRLTLHDGESRIITEAGTLFGNLSHIIDHAFDECSIDECEDRR